MKTFKNKKILNNFYHKKFFSSLDIAKKFKVSDTTIVRYLKFYNIPLRTRSEAQFLRIKLNKNVGWSNKIFKKGSKSLAWKGGRKETGKYIFVYSPNHPNNIKNYMQEHRLIMEKYLRRYLNKEEQIHHKDENGHNNKFKNLYLCKNNKEHSLLHSKAYSYLVYTNQTEKFLSWFDKEYKYVKNN